MSNASHLKPVAEARNGKGETGAMKAAELDVQGILLSVETDGAGGAARPDFHDHSDHDDNCPICWAAYWEAWREYRAEEDAEFWEDDKGYPVEGW
jgi:hypothetical protein